MKSCLTESAAAYNLIEIGDALTESTSGRFVGHSCVACSQGYVMCEFLIDGYF